MTQFWSPVENEDWSRPTQYVEPIQGSLHFSIETRAARYALALGYRIFKPFRLLCPTLNAVRSR